MIDREKVIKGLEYCQSACVPDDCECCPLGDCSNAPYTFRITPEVHDAILSLLKAQEPRVMTLEVMPEWDGAFLVESRRKGDMVWASWYAEYELYGETVTRMVDIDGAVDDRAKRMYGSEWRAWTSRPTDAQREAVKWDAAD